jgi:hypothetical protein
MNVRIHVTTLINNVWEPVLEANYVMAARDKFENKGVPVHRIDPTTEEEKHLFKEAEEKRKQRSTQSEIPTQQEACDIHEIFLNLEKYRLATDNVVSGPHVGEFRTIKSTVYTKPVIMHPQVRSLQFLLNLVARINS